MPAEGQLDLQEYIKRGKTLDLGYTPNAIMTEMAFTLAGQIWAAADEIRSGVKTVEDLPIAKGFHPLCDWCDFNADCPRFEGITAPQMELELERLECLKQEKALAENRVRQYGYNKKSANVILQIFDFDAVKKSRTLGWKADLAMLVDMDGQMLIDDKDVHKWLLTEEGVKEVSKYASIYAPWFTHLAIPSKDGKSWSTAPCLKWAKAEGMKVHTWTHRTDSLAKGFTSEEAMFDAMFKQMKLDGLFSDFPNHPIAYLKKNGIR